ncbi:MAG TPA: ABC transporter permease [Terriglobales bacterium]|jgi:putative ABC transport system permease protein
MNPVSIIRQAARSLTRHWIQSVLSIVGIAVGVAAFVCVVGIGNAGTAAVEDELKNLGDNFIWVEAGSRNRNGIRNGARGTRSLVLADAQAIMEQVPLIRTMSPNVDGRVQVIYGQENWYTFYRGVSPEFLQVRRWEMRLGSFFSQADVDAADPVCVLGQTVVDYLFGEDNPIGRTVRIQTLPCQVVGVLRRKGFDANGRDQDDFVLLPYTTVQKRLIGTFWLDDIFCSAVTTASMPEAARQITALLRERHHLTAGENDDFNIRRPEDAIKAQLESREIMRLLLASIASLSLIVGGIGIMNIMLVAVTQRTKEIGIRLAVGATEAVIQVQFLLEAVAIGLFGASLGVLLGFFSSGVVAELFAFPAQLTTQTFVYGAAFAAGTAIIFGYYPAVKASQLDPIQALRYE